MNVGEEDRYQFVTSQIEYTTEKIYDSFKSFFQLLSAVAGGYVFTRSMQSMGSPFWLRTATPALLCVLGAGSVILIAVNIANKRRYLEEEASLRGKEEMPQQTALEWVMVGIIGLVTLAAMVYSGAQ